VLDPDLGPPQEGGIWGLEPRVCSNTTYHQITLAFVKFVALNAFLLSHFQMYLLITVDSTVFRASLADIAAVNLEQSVETEVCIELFC